MRYSVRLLCGSAVTDGRGEPETDGVRPSRKCPSLLLFTRHRCNSETTLVVLVMQLEESWPRGQEPPSACCPTASEGTCLHHRETALWLCDSGWAPQRAEESGLESVPRHEDYLGFWNACDNQTSAVRVTPIIREPGGARPDPTNKASLFSPF